MVQAGKKSDDADIKMAVRQDDAPSIHEEKMITIVCGNSHLHWAVHNGKKEPPPAPARAIGTTKGPCTRCKLGWAQGWGCVILLGQIVCLQLLSIVLQMISSSFIEECLK
jgi:hypothetical protein